MTDPYVYEGTDVLINRFGLRDGAKLGAVERHVSESVIEETLEDEPPVAFGFQTLLDYHRRLFEDVYPFAGLTRTIPLWKAEIALGGRTVEYAGPDEIAAAGEEAANALSAVGRESLKKRDGWKRGAKALSDLWRVHAFREGNTRALLLFAEGFFRRASAPVDMAVISRTPSETRDALVLAAEGRPEEFTKLLVDARRAFMRRRHPDFGMLSSEAAEALSYFPDMKTRHAAEGEEVTGQVLCTSYGTVLVITREGVLGVPSGSFPAVPRNDARVKVTAAAKDAGGYDAKKEKLRRLLAIRAELERRPGEIVPDPERPGFLHFPYRRTGNAAWAESHPAEASSAAESVLRKKLPEAFAEWAATLEETPKP